jgi:hypothetical protein
MGDRELPPALLAALHVPALSMVPEQPGCLPASWKLAVEGPRLHGTVDAVVTHGEARMLHRDAARYLLRGPVLVAHELHDQGAPLRIVHEPRAPAAQPSRVRAPLCGRCTVALSGRPLPSVAPDLAGYGRLVPAELPRYLADPLMALPADHDVLALRDAKMAVAVHGASNDACLRKHHHRSCLGGCLVFHCCARSADSPYINSPTRWTSGSRSTSNCCFTSAWMWQMSSSTSAAVAWSALTTKPQCFSLTCAPPHA